MASEMTPFEVCLSVLGNRDATDSEIQEAAKKAGFKREIQTVKNHRNAYKHFQGWLPLKRLRAPSSSD
tara:strand:- start:4222 stop:4425 length:204 start_codon:yes stop_codon:yes gene_type:complete